MSQPITVVFDNPEKTIIRWDFRGRWTWDDWYAGTRRALELRATVYDTPCVPAIFDVKHSGPVPMGALPHARTAMEMMDPRDYVIIAHASGFIRSITEAFRLLNPTFREKVFLARTVAEARQMIAQREQEQA
jgi:hypothetical protein